MKIQRILIVMALGMAAPGLHAQAAVVENLMDQPLALDWNYGWLRPQAQGAAKFETSAHGLLPTAGDSFWSGFRGNEGQVILRQNFPDARIKEGTYTISFDVGAGAAPLEFVVPLFAVIATPEGSSYNYDNRIPDSARTVVSNPTPDAGTWKTWTFTYEITADTRTEWKKPVIGSSLGIIFLRQVSASQGFAIDNLKITYAPPSKTN